MATARAPSHHARVELGDLRASCGGTVLGGFEESGELAMTHAFVAEWRGDSDSDDSDELLQCGSSRKCSSIWPESDRTHAETTRAIPVLTTQLIVLRSAKKTVSRAPIAELDEESVSEASPNKCVKVHTRTRRAQEIKRLHVEREELEKRLQVVRETVKAWPLRSLGLCDLGHDSSSPAVVAIPMDSRQQHQTEQERQALLRSEKENQRLRAELKAQKQAARSLYRLMRRRAADMAVLRKSLRVPSLACTLSRDTQDDRAVFSRLLADTRAMFADVESVAALLRSRIKLSDEGSFRAWDVNRRAVSRRGASTAPASHPGRQLHLVDCEELPFPRSQVHHAIRAFYKETEVRDFAREHFGLADDDGGDDTIMMKKVFSYETGAAGLVHFRMRQVVRSFFRTEYSGFVSMLVVEGLTDDGQLVGRTDTEQKWTILPRECTDAASLRSGHETTQNQTFAIITNDAASHVQVPQPPLKAAARGNESLPREVDEWDSSYSSTNRRIQNHLMSKSVPQMC